EEEEEEEHLASANAAVVAPTVKPGSPPASISLPPEAEVERLLAMPTPPPSPLTSLSPPSAGERLARIASTQALIHVVTVVLPSPLLPPPIDRKDNILEIELPPRKKSCLKQDPDSVLQLLSRTARPTRGQRIDYGFVSTLDAEARRRGIRKVGLIELAELHEHDTHELYALLKDAQDSRTQISHRVTMDSQRVDLLMEDRIAYQETILIVEEEAYAS
nr:hypothetical protein [Tanacetum cinerariifolium]